MKRIIMTVIATLALCGAIFAQGYTSHWIEELDTESSIPWGDNLYVVPFVQIDGSYITLEDNYEAMELGAFIDGECRGHFFLYDDGEEYPTTELCVYLDASTESNKEITFKLYDHELRKEYVDQETRLVANKSYIDLYYGNYDLVPILNFTTPGITKEIVPFTGEKDHYYLIASPVGAVEPTSVTNMTANEYDLYSFDQSGVDGEGNPREWRNYKAGAFTSLEPGKGYLYANGGNGEDDVVILSFPGSAYTEATSVTIESKSDAPYFTGWNLIGNPYNEDVYIDRSFYRMTDGVINPNLEAGAIHPMEGVFVTTEQASEELAFSTTAPGKIANVAMNLSKGGDFVDRAIVRFDNGSQLPKFMFRESGTKLYVQQGSKDFSVVGAEGNGEVPVSFKAEADGIYTINVTTEEVGFSYLHLVDNMNGNDVDLLATPSYTFDARTTDYTSRFKLVFVSDAASESESFAFFSNGSWVIANDGEAVLQVVDLNGRVLSNEQISGCVSKAVNAAPGVYMLRLVKGDDMKVQKVVVK